MYAVTGVSRPDLLNQGSAGQLLGDFQQMPVSGLTASDPHSLSQGSLLTFPNHSRYVIYHDLQAV
jgi:hypothetical protein